MARKKNINKNYKKNWDKFRAWISVNIPDGSKYVLLSKMKELETGKKMHTLRDLEKENVIDWEFRDEKSK